MKKNKIKEDMNLDFDAKVSFNEIKNNLNISSDSNINYFTSKSLLKEYYESNSLLCNPKYINKEANLGIEVKWYYPRFHENIKLNIELTEHIHEEVTDMFWYKANDIAKNYNFIECISYGRSGGWAMPIAKNNKFLPAFYSVDFLDLEIISQFEIFNLFASSIENLFSLIKKEVKNIQNTNQLKQLTEGIGSL